MAATSSRIRAYPTTYQGIRNLDQPRQSSRNDPLRINVGEGERTRSAIGGAALFGLGAAHGGCLGLGMIWTGAAVFLRGVTGHCTMKEALGHS